MNFLFLIPIAFANFYWWFCLVCAHFFFKKPGTVNYFPGVYLLKPICGLEKGLKENLESCCRQNYPNYEIIFAVHSKNDSALPLLKELQKKYSQIPIWIVEDEERVGPNGKINNIHAAAKKAKHEVVVVSDSDVCMESNYLRSIVAPLASADTGIACTLYKAVGAKSIGEKFGLISFNCDFIPSVVMAVVTGASHPCLGISKAIKRSLLDKMGGFSAFAHYLVEDFEMGKRAREMGYKVAFVPHVVKTTIDLKGLKSWFKHQLYWDQKTCTAAPVGFFFTWLIRGVPLAFVYLLVNNFDFFSLKIFLATVLSRMASAALFSHFYLQDDESLLNLLYLPFRDVLGLFTWGLSFLKKTMVWRGTLFQLKRKKIVEKVGLA